MEISDPSKRFNDFVSKSELKNKELPLVHITNCYNFVEICKTGKLETFECNVMKANRVFMFYGRPAYRVGSNASAELTYALPCALLFRDMRQLPAICDVFPFDTGAFAKGKYDRFFADRSKVEHFRLDGSTASARKLVACFFESNENYYNGRSGKNVDISAIDFEAQGVHELAKTIAHPLGDARMPFDERASAIEIQFDGAIELKKSIWKLIIPSNVYDDENVRTAISDLFPGQVETYDTVAGNSSDQIATLIYEKIRSLYKENEVF